MIVIGIAKVVLVIVLLGVAAAVATPKGRLPLALRGVMRMVRRDRGESGCAAAEKGEPVSAGKKFFAFLLVIIAIIVAVI